MIVFFTVLFTTFAVGKYENIHVTCIKSRTRCRLMMFHVSSCACSEWNIDYQCLAILIARVLGPLGSNKLNTTDTPSQKENIIEQ